MANYYCTLRTNYFKVTDEARLKELVRIARAELFSKEDGYFGFGLINADPIDTLYDDEDNESYLNEEIQKILPEGEMCIITEVGNEKLRYISAFATLLTKDTSAFIDLNEEIRKKAVEINNNLSEMNLTLEY